MYTPWSKVLERVKIAFSSDLKQERRKHLNEKWGTRSKKGHITTPISGQSSKRFESIPNQVHTAFGWELKIIELGVYLKSCYFIWTILIVEWKNGMPKLSSKVKIINMKVKLLYHGFGRGTIS